MKIQFTIILLCCFELAFSQDVSSSTNNRGIFNITELGYSRGFGRINYSDGIKVKNGGYVGRFRTIFGYFIDPKFSIGIGAGLDGYHNPTYNTFPVLVDARYYFKTGDLSPFINVDIGYSLKLGDPFEEGIYSGVGIGYKFLQGKKINFLINTGIDFHQIKDARLLVINYPYQYETIRSTVTLTSIFFKFGLLF